MRHERVVLESVVESVADGVDIDWAALEERVDDDKDRRVLEQLKVLARIAEVHRSHASEPDDNPVARFLHARGSFTGGKVIPIHAHQPVAETTPSAHSGRSAPVAPPLAPFTRWGHLELHERIGEGTFGEVYRARDTQLDREVAVKLLRVGGASTDAPTRRVLREGRALARVKHDNVVTVYGADTHDGRVGLWMSLIRGATLEQLLRGHGPFSAREAAFIGQDLCSAVAAVHNAGLVHRDIKPQNVMREEGGRLVLMDFGAGQLVGDDTAALDRLTGTPLYLAPEVLDGGESTPQSDIYSIGVLLYHLVTNDYPARASSLDDLRKAHATGRRTHLHDARPELPAGLIQVIERALEADPARRYQTAGEMRAALDRAFSLHDDRDAPSWLRLPAPIGARLQRMGRTRMLGVGLAAGIVLLAFAVVVAWEAVRRTGAPTATPPRVIAVLDLARGAGVQEHEAASVTEGIQDLLSTSDTLRIVSRRSVQAASKGDLAPPDLAKKLSADTLIDGRLEQVAQEYRLTLRLIRAGSGSDHSVAVGTFTAPMAKRLMLVFPAADATAHTLGVRLPPSAGEKLKTTQLLANDAFDRYTRARYYLNTVAHEGHPDVAVRLFEEAIAVAPAFGQAHAGLARARYYRAMGAGQKLWERLGEARADATRALELDPTLADAHAVIGVVDFYSWKWDDAERAFQRAIALNPSNEFAAERYAAFLSARGRVDEGIARMVQVTQIDPLSPLAACSTATVLHYAGRYDEALREVQRARSFNPNDPAAYFVQGRILAATGRFDEAIASFEQAHKASGGNRPALAEIAAAHAGAGRPEKALAMMADLEAAARRSGERFPPELFAFVYAQLGDFDRAFESLERAAQERSPRLLLLNVDPRAQPLRHDPRFAMLLQRLDLQASVSDGAR